MPSSSSFWAQIAVVCEELAPLAVPALTLTAQAAHAMERADQRNQQLRLTNVTESGSVPKRIRASRKKRTKTTA